MYKKIQKKLQRFGIWLGMLLIFCCVYIQQTYAAENENAIEDARNAIVEIQSGFVDSKGTFCQMKYGSGFLISNDDGAAYIITSQNIADNTLEDIKEYCKNNQINTENTQFTNSVRIVVKDDITVNAEILVKSEIEDYCILSTQNVVSEKSALKIGDISKLNDSAKVYVLGFPTESEKIAFSNSDVEVIDGKIENKNFSDEKISKIEHTIQIPEGSVGGPLLDENGYVVGVNIGQAAESLAISEVAEVLDNFSIYYGSRMIDENRKKLETLYAECTEMSTTDQYKKDSLENLIVVLESVKTVLENSKSSATELQEAYNTLTDAKNKLIPKMAKIMVAIYVLACVIVFLIVWLMILCISNYKDIKKRRIVKSPVHSVTMNEERIEPTAGSVKNSVKLELLRVSNGQTVFINKPNFYIGSRPEMVDYCIQDNRAVSRRHAMINSDGQRFYFCDLKSSNGSKVNGKSVHAGEKICLHTGDELLLADEKFMVL